MFPAFETSLSDPSPGGFLEFWNERLLNSIRARDIVNTLEICARVYRRRR